MDDGRVHPFTLNPTFSRATTCDELFVMDD